MGRQSAISSRRRALAVGLALLMLAASFSFLGPGRSERPGAAPATHEISPPAPPPPWKPPSVGSTLVLSNETLLPGRFNATNGDGAWGVSYDTAKHVLYAAEYGYPWGAVAVVSVGSGGAGAVQTVINTSGPSGGPTATAYAAPFGEVLAVNGAISAIGTLSAINDTTNTVTSTTALGNAPDSIVYDTRRGEVFVANEFSDNVSVVNLSHPRTVVASITVGQAPFGIAYDPSKNEVFVCNANQATVSVISDLNNSLAATINTGIACGAAVYDPGTGEIWFGSATGYLFAVNDSTNAVVAYVSVSGLDVTSIAYVPASNAIYAGMRYLTNYSSYVVAVSDRTNLLIGTIPVGGGAPFGAAYVASLHQLYVDEYYSQNITVISTLTRTTVGDLRIGAAPTALVADPAKGEIFVGNDLGPFGGEVQVLSSTTLSLVRTISVPPDPNALLYVPQFGEIFVSCFTPNVPNSAVAVINDTTDQVVALLGTYYSPDGLAFDPLTSTVWVTATGPAGGGNVTLINATSNTIQGSLILTTSAGKVIAPWGVAYDPSSETMYVAAYTSATTVLVNALNYTTVGYAATGSDPENVVDDPGRGEIFVANEGGASVTVINATTRLPVGTVGVGSSPRQLVYVAAANEVIVADYSSDNLALISDLSNQLLGYAPTGATPIGVGLDPVTGTLYSVNKAAGTLSLFGPLSPVPTFTVVVNEAGLPLGSAWTFTASGIAHPSTGRRVTFAEPNGTFAFSVGAVTGYLVVNGSTGRFTVAGASTTVSVTYALSFVATIAENGLANGSNWGAYFNGVLNTTFGSFVQFLVTNGTYPYSVAAPVGYVAQPWSGSADVNGAPLRVAINFTRVTYAATFQESGLPSGTPWSINVSGTIGSSSTSSITVRVPNGSFSYSVLPVSGYTTSSGNGSFSVVGAGYATTIPFTRLPSRYAVSFEELGLPAGTQWNVTLEGSNLSSRAAYANYTEYNGSYRYNLSSPGFEPSPGAGTASVDGAPVEVTVRFVRIDYAVTFTEQRLPPDTPWSVSVGGQTLSATSASIVASLPNGSFPYTIGSVAGYATVWDGVVVVRNATLSVPVVFSEFPWAVRFTESGLPSGTFWSVTLGEEVNDSDAPTISFAVPNGSYRFTVQSNSGFIATPASGSVTVAGALVVVTVTYAPAPPTTYVVTFSETGTPGTLGWFVNVTGEAPLALSTGTGQLELPNGTYAIAYGAGGAIWQNTSASRRVVVDGAPVKVAVVFVRLYALSAVESGLPSGTLWYLNLTEPSLPAAAPRGPLPAESRLSFSARGPSITTTLSNGTYAFQVSSVDGGSLPDPSNGSFTVDGANAPAIVVAFTAVYPFSIVEVGLPEGTPWTIVVAGELLHANGTSITVRLANGTYAYSVGSLPGYRSIPSSGTLTVAGPSGTLTLAFRSTGSAGGTSGVGPLSTVEWVGVAAVAATIGLAALLAVRRRGRPASATLPPRRPSPAAQPRADRASTPPDGGAVATDEEYETYGQR